jgi:hypothetical protein
MFCSAAPPQIGVEEGHRLQRELVADLHEDEVMTASQLEVKSENCACRHIFRTHGAARFVQGPLTNLSPRSYPTEHQIVLSKLLHAVDLQAAQDPICTVTFENCRKAS